MKENRKTIQILVILTMIFTIVGGTLAYWQWNTSVEQETNVVFTVTQDFSCAADGGGNISYNDVKLAPTTCTDTSRAIKRKVTVTPTLDRDRLTVSLDLWLNINELGEGLKKSNNFRYVLTTSSNSCEEGTIISEGNFKGRKIGDKIPLITNDLHTVTEDEEYWLYIWLDKEETNSNTMNQKFNFDLGGTCDEVETLVGDAYAIVTEGRYDEEEKWQYYDLTFVRSETIITSEDKYDGKEILEVYTGFEGAEYDYYGAPWSDFSYGSIVVEDTIRPISTANWFDVCGMTNMDVDPLLLIDIDKLDTSQVTNMSSMFGCMSLGESIEIDLSSFDTSKVVNMTGVFYSMNNFLGIENWNTSNVESMASIFGEVIFNKDIDLSGWDTSKVESMASMFEEGEIYGDLGISEWNTSNVTNMLMMFEYTTINVELGISDWDTSSVTNMSNMFYEVTLDYSLDLNAWDVSSVTEVEDFSYSDNIISPFVMFSFCDGDQYYWVKPGTTWGEFAKANGGYWLDEEEYGDPVVQLVLDGNFLGIVLSNDGINHFDNDLGAAMSYDVIEPGDYTTNG